MPSKICAYFEQDRKKEQVGGFQSKVFVELKQRLKKSGIGNAFVNEISMNRFD